MAPKHKKPIFNQAPRDEYNPEYGEVLWKRRLNQKLEDTGTEILPVQFDDGVNGPMQITQENTIIFVNQIADEMDCLAMNYPPNLGEQVWFFREQFLQRGTSIEEVSKFIGGWALQTVTLYPMSSVVEMYEKTFDAIIPDELPDNFS
jgi:hypothetical protein